MNVLQIYLQIIHFYKFEASVIIVNFANSQENKINISYLLKIVTYTLFLLSILL